MAQVARTVFTDGTIVRLPEERGRRYTTRLVTSKGRRYYELTHTYSGRTRIVNLDRPRPVK
jgi:hypothetical protein